MNIEDKNHISLFSGQGGFDLASDWAGWNNIAHCEFNPFCLKVLKYYWPDADSYEDIKESSFKKYRGFTDVVSGGFPCQPFSQAGKKQGTDDDRYLWPEAKRAFVESQPGVVVFENVPGLFSILQPDSVSEVERKEVQLFCEDETLEANAIVERVQRRVLGVILEEIRAEGYTLPETTDGTPIILCVPACSTGAPHRRDRVIIIAFSERNINQRKERREYAKAQRMAQLHGKDNSSSGEFGGAVAELVDGRESYQHEHQIPHTDTIDQRLQGNQQRPTSGSGPGAPRSVTKPFENEHWLQAATRLCVVDDGLPGRLDGITLPKWTTESIKAAGNSVQPQLFYEIFKIIDSML